MGSVGDCYDKALCERYLTTLEGELLDRVIFHTLTEARQNVFQFSEGWYNPHRRHSSIDYMSPVRYEFAHWVQVFGGERLTAALLDRLTHHAHIIELLGESHRFRQRLQQEVNHD